MDGARALALTIRALLVVRDDPRDFGVWQLAALPAEGHVMVIGVNNQPAYFRVVNVFHVPVPGTDASSQAMPYVAIGLEPYTPPDPLVSSFALSADPVTTG